MRGQNDDHRRLWVLNDEGLYNAFRRSGRSMDGFIRHNRAFIDEVTQNVVSGAQPAHYLVQHRRAEKWRRNGDEAVGRTV